MLADRTTIELAAINRLLVNPDFGVFKGWLERSLDAAVAQMAEAESDVWVRRYQGVVLALKAQIKALESTKAVMERTR